MVDRPSILHVGKFYPPHRGGIETHLRTVCTRLARQLTVRVLVTGDGLRRKEISENGFRVTKVPNWLTCVGAPLSPGMLSEMRRSQETLVHLHWPNPGAVLAYLAVARHKPLVVTWHSDVVRQRRLGRAFEPIVKQFLAFSSAIIVTSPNYLASSHTLRPFRDRCRVIPFGIEYRDAGRQDLEKAANIRKAHGDRIVLTVGRLVQYKGLTHLIRAMRDVQATLIVVGDGPLRKQLEAQATVSGLNGRVVFAGEVDEISPYYQACDVFALPSIARSEAFGIVQLEAMAAGRPVVNTELASGVPFVSVDGLTGKTVRPADPSVLAAALNLLLDDHELRTTYGRAAKVRARETFSVDEMVRKTIEIYLQASEGGSGRPAVEFEHSRAAARV
jgi:glycosyltransferase involved in cell wall biosynthesis